MAQRSPPPEPLLPAGAIQRRVKRRSSALRRATIALAWRPEWLLAVVVAMAWVALAVIPASSSHQGAHGSHSAASMPVGVAIGGWALGGWALMSVAMMVPVTLPAVRHVGLNSIRRRRWAMAVYVASYVAVWVLALALVWAVRSAGAWSTGLGERQLVVGALVIATLWQLMLLMAVVGHSSLVVMAALTAGVVAERRASAGRRLIALLGGALAVATVWTVLLG